MATKTGLEAIAMGRKGYSVLIKDLKLNPTNKRSEYGDFPKELAELVVSSETLTEEQIAKIKDALNQGDPDSDKSMIWLVNSVMKNGVKDTISGYFSNGSVIVTAGNRRTTAAHICVKVFGLEPFYVPFQSIGQRPTESDILLEQYLENSGKLDLKPIDTGRLLKELLDFFPIEVLSAKVSLSPKKINEFIGLLSLSPEAQQAIAEGTALITPVLNVIKDTEKAVSDPLRLNKIVSEAIVEASTNARARGKNKATEREIKAATSKRIVKSSNKETSSQNDDKDSLIDELQSLLANPMILDSLDSKSLEGLIRKIKKDSGM